MKINLAYLKIYADPFNLCFILCYTIDRSNSVVIHKIEHLKMKMKQIGL